MSIQKKSLISTLKTTKKANLVKEDSSVKPETHTSKAAATIHNKSTVLNNKSSVVVNRKSAFRHKIKMDVKTRAL